MYTGFFTHSLEYPIEEVDTQYIEGYMTESGFVKQEHEGVVIYIPELDMGYPRNTVIFQDSHTLRITACLPEARDVVEDLIDVEGAILGGITPKTVKLRGHNINPDHLFGLAKLLNILQGWMCFLQ